MLKIVGQTSVKLAAFLAAACVVAGGISPPAALAQSGETAVEIDDAQVSLYSKPAGSCARTPIVSDITTHRDKKATLDVSNVSEGYIMVKYMSNAGEIKTRVTKSGSETYTYDLNNSGVHEVFPLSESNGSYQVKVFENIQGNRYSQTFSRSIDAGVINQSGPFLYPSQYTDFNAASAMVRTGVAVAASVPGQIRIVTAVYSYVIDSVPYDTAKVTSVQSGYLPNVDVVLVQKKGVCFDYVVLMMAILCSQGTPTKSVAGYTGNPYHTWINVYLGGWGWVDNIIYFDGNSWKLVDPTLASSSGQNQETMQYIGNGTNYKVEYSY